MKVLILRNTVAGRKPVSAGEVVELAEREARELIQMGKAAPSVAEATPPPVVKQLEEEFETADLRAVEIETSVKRGKRKE